MWRRPPAAANQACSPRRDAAFFHVACEIGAAAQRHQRLRHQEHRPDEGLEDVVEQLTYDFLSDTQAGWENDDGAYGEFCFDASARTIHLEFNERFTSSELFTHDF